VVPEKIGRIPIEMTIVDGKVAFKREGQGNDGVLE
jgi:hypothetical protein